MTGEPPPEQCFVLKAKEIPALNYLAKRYPRPISLGWINRGTNQELRSTTVQMLLRTLFSQPHSPSISRLHQTSGLRVVFGNAEDRMGFSNLYEIALREFRQRQRSEVTAIFDTPIAAERAFQALAQAGVRKGAISLLWRAGQFLESNYAHPPGHTRLNVAAASAGAGLAGAIFGISLLTIPGIGLVAAGGALAANAVGTMGAVGGALGASGGGIARMLTDLDVDDREIPYFAMRIARGKVFVSVDPAECGYPVEQVREILDRHGGQFAPGEGQ